MSVIQTEPHAADQTPELDAPVGAPTVALTPEDLAATRDLVLRAHPNVVAALIQGTTVAELIASIGPASAAYAAVSQQLATDAAREERTTQATPPTVPAGGTPAPVVDPETLPASEKIRRGIAARRPGATG